MSKGNRTPVKKAAPKPATPSWLFGLLTGLVVGGFAVFLWQLKSVPPQSSSVKSESRAGPLFGKSEISKPENSKSDSTKPESKEPAKPINGSDNPAATIAKNAPKAEIVKPEKVEKESAEDEYSFYSVLSSSEQPININKPAPHAAKKPDASVTDSQPSYVLQAGSFKDNAIAESVRAKLLLDGFSVNVQPVKIHDNETWFRVMVGPFTNPAAASEAKDVLAKNKINSMLLQIKPKPIAGNVQPH